MFCCLTLLCVVVCVSRDDWLLVIFLQLIVL